MKTETPPQAELKFSGRIPKGLLWIDGNWRNAESGNKFETVNPATEEVLAQLDEAGPNDVDTAVQSAARAFESGPWRNMKASERARLLQRIAGLIRHFADELAWLESVDGGKPIAQTRESDIPAAAEAFEYYSGWCGKLSGETLEIDPGYQTYTLREPIGVIAAITPWNFPLVLAAQKIAPALAAGNCVVLKPAEQTSLTALRLAEITAEAGLPPGVLNVITGFGPGTGSDLVKHSQIDAISFTGECRTGQEIMKHAAPGLKRLMFELGGKSPNLVFADADLDRAAEAACEGIFFNQGQVCSAGSRLLVEESIASKFLDLVCKKASLWQPGDPLNEKTNMGAVISKEHLQKILGYIKAGQKEGAVLRLDGKGMRPKGMKKGFFVGPTIFEKVRPAMQIAQEEIFGPVLCQMSFRSFDHAMEIANQTPFGLAAAVWTKDISKAHRAVRRLRAGTVWINTYGAYDHAIPFGGYQMSGFGREGGGAVFESYTQLKSIWIDCGHASR